MAAEAPRFEIYQALVRKTEDLTIANCRDKQVEDYALVRCIMAAVNAHEEGLSDQEIADAMREGIAGGVTLYQNVQTGGETIEYWRYVRADAHAFGDMRNTTDE